MTAWKTKTGMLSTLSTGTLGLVVAFSPAVVFVSEPAHAASPVCEALFSGRPLYTVLNRDARVTGASYQTPKERTLSQAEHALTQNTGEVAPGLIKPIQLVKLVPVYGTVVDLSGGNGQAMLELVKAKSMNAIVVNSREVPPRWDQDDLHVLPYKAKIEQRVGWAEEILVELKGQASLVIDVRGAFTRTGLKLEFLATVYDSLIKSGVPNELGHKSENGVALLTYDRFGTPVTIETAQGPKDLARYLVDKYPTIFSVHFSANAEIEARGIPSHERLSSGQEMHATHVIRMVRDPKIETLSFPVGLPDVTFGSLASGAKIHPRTRYIER